MPIEVKWPFEHDCNMSLGWRLTSKLVMSVVGTAGIIASTWLNRTTVYNREALYRAIDDRPKDRALLTVCNHHSTLDEPVLWGMLKWRHLTWNNEVMRWTLGAADVCFTREFHSKFFAYGRTVPVCRGEGVYQYAMDFCLQRMNEGGWVHAYPEGRINADHSTIRLKWGVGRLVAECEREPIVLPFHHLGMDDLVPNKSPYRPRVGQRITALIGEPMEFSRVRQAMRAGAITRRQARKEITDRIQEEFEILKEKTRRLHYAQC